MSVADGLTWPAHLHLVWPNGRCMDCCDMTMSVCHQAAALLQAGVLHRRNTPSGAKPLVVGVQECSAVTLRLLQPASSLAPSFCSARTPILLMYLDYSFGGGRLMPMQQLSCTFLSCLALLCHPNCN